MHLGHLVLAHALFFYSSMDAFIISNVPRLLGPKIPDLATPFALCTASAGLQLVVPTIFVGPLIFMAPKFTSWAHPLSAARAHIEAPWAKLSPMGIDGAVEGRPAAADGGRKHNNILNGTSER